MKHLKRHLNTIEDNKERNLFKMLYYSMDWRERTKLNEPLRKRRKKL